MTTLNRIALTPLALLAFASACKNADDTKPESRQVELAPAPATQPQLADTAAAAPAKRAAPAKAATSAPPARSAASAAPAAAAAPVAVAGRGTGVIAAGSSIGVATTARVCTNTYHVGDQVTATVSAVARGSNDVEVPTGATMTLRVTESKRGENGKEGIRLAFAPVSLAIGTSTYAVDGTASVGTLEKVAAQSTGEQVKKVAAGAAIGAIAGKLIGKKNKDAVIGGVVGAAAGGAIAAGTTDWIGCLPQGGRVDVTLSQPLIIKKTP